MSFSGLRFFNPALVDVYLIDLLPGTDDDLAGGRPFSRNGILSLMNEGVTELPSYGNMLVGAMGGSLGEVSAVALILGLLFMLWKRSSWQIPVSILATVFVFTGIMHLVNPVQYASPFVHLLSGGLLLAPSLWRPTT